MKMIINILGILSLIGFLSENLVGGILITAISIILAIILKKKIINTIGIIAWVIIILASIFKQNHTIGVIIGIVIILMIVFKNMREKKRAKTILERENCWYQSGLPTITHSYFLLKKGETLHLYAPVTFLKAGKKISQGLFSPITKPYLKEKDVGTLFLTNKRLVFNSTRNISYSLNNIAHIESVGKAIGILKENEAMVKFFEFENKETMEECAAMISFLLGQGIEHTEV